MKERNKGVSTIDQYIKAFAKRVQEKLESIRRRVKKVAPEAQEKISYQIPACGCVVCLPSADTSNPIPLLNGLSQNFLDIFH